MKLNNFIIMICEYCGKEFHEISFGSGRFCSKHCARCYTSNMRKKTKICKCIDCGKEFEVNVEISSKNFRCSSCKEEYLDKKYIASKNNINDISAKIKKLHRISF